MDNNEYGIVCNQDSTIVDYQHIIGDRIAHLFKQNRQMIQDLWLLLDDCSTIDIICNLHLVIDIYKVDQRCIITTNAGILVVLISR